MGLTRKPITVHFFSIKAEENTIHKIVGAYSTLQKHGNGTDIFVHSNNRYLLKCLASNVDRDPIWPTWVTVRERNTWQVRTQSDGSLSPLQDSNSLVGDPSFFKLNPENKTLAAFTTHSATGYLKALCVTALSRFLPRSLKLEIDYLTDDEKIAQIKKWDFYSKISIKLDISKLSKTEEKPDLINALLAINKTFGGNTISVTLDSGKDRLPKSDITETINYLSENDGCETLSLAGGHFNEEERTLPINLKKAFVKYPTSIDLKPNQTIIKETDAEKILTEALGTREQHI